MRSLASDGITFCRQPQASAPVRFWLADRHVVATIWRCPANVRLLKVAKRSLAFCQKRDERIDIQKVYDTVLITICFVEKTGRSQDGDEGIDI